MSFGEMLSFGETLIVLPYILLWLCLSTGLIFMNASILQTMPYPSMLTAWHMLFSSILVHVLRQSAPRSWGVFGAEAPVLGFGTIVKKILPIATLFALTLSTGNRAYIHCSIAFIQMVKASHGPLTYVLSVAVGSEQFNMSKFQLTFSIALGVILSVTGELRFSPAGFMFQACGSFTECLRVVLIGLLLNNAGLKLTPLVALSYYAPLCFAFLVPFSMLTELPEDWGKWNQDFEKYVGWPWMVLNGLVAFSLNVATLLLIQKTSAVVYILCGIAKDIMIIMMSVVMMSTPISAQQVVGYIIAVASLQVFNQVGKNVEMFERRGVFGATLELMNLQSGPPKVSTATKPHDDGGAPMNEAREKTTSAVAQSSPPAAVEAFQDRTIMGRSSFGDEEEEELANLVSKGAR